MVPRETIRKILMPLSARAADFSQKLETAYQTITKKN
jgi:hypothetical protein